MQRRAIQLLRNASEDDIRRFVLCGGEFSYTEWDALSENQKMVVESGYSDRVFIAGIMDAYIEADNDQLKETLARALKPFDGGALYNLVRLTNQQKELE